ncbi:MAG: YraN family protein [Anaerolineae bacterium]
MTKGTVGLGRRGEALAAEVLSRHGYTVVARNWYCASGEVDIVAERNGELTFFEVRTRRGRRYGTPEQSLRPRKRARMNTVARRYLSEEVDSLDAAWHLGLVAVQLDRRGRVVRISVYPDLEGEPWDAEI